jgi:hypothetical protein
MTWLAGAMLAAAALTRVTVAMRAADVPADPAMRRRTT